MLVLIFKLTYGHISFNVSVYFCRKALSERVNVQEGSINSKSIVSRMRRGLTYYLLLYYKANTYTYTFFSNITTNFIQYCVHHKINENII